jgi:SAM-dependent methyltransferase
MTNPRQHWEQVYQTKAPTEVSWFQAKPLLSLELIRTAAPDHAAGIIDVGGGASRLVDELLAEGYADVSVLDVSDAALARSKERLGSLAEAVDWLVADITAWRPARTWDVWHDRAVFHFLTEPAQQDAYIAVLRQATRSGAAIVIATFALDGPERCSGLVVQRYSPQTLAERLGSAFALVEERSERHVTPGGSIQRFAYAVLRRR